MPTPSYVSIIYRENQYLHPMNYYKKKVLNNSGHSDTIINTNTTVLRMV